MNVGLVCCAVSLIPGGFIAQEETSRLMYSTDTLMELIIHKVFYTFFFTLIFCPLAILALISLGIFGRGCFLWFTAKRQNLR